MGPFLLVPMNVEVTMNRYRFLWLSMIVALVIGIPAGLMGIEERRPVAAGVCPPVPNTPFFTIVYGTVALDDSDAPVGTMIEARSPRNDVVGCFVVGDPGDYGAMYVYGEDTSVSPPVPGMRSGEVIAFCVNGVGATASPELTWVNDRDLHQVNLSACVLFGNFDCDREITVADIMLVASRWRMTDEDPDWEARYDLNGDGIITVVDIMKVAANWGKTCE